MRRDDTPSAIPHDGLNRQCPDWASPVSLLAQRLAFIGRGGVIQKIPAGLTAYDHSNSQSKARASAGGRKGSAAKTGIAERRKLKIRMEEGL